MEFTGRLYYDFVSPQVFRLYRVLAAAQREGVEIGLDWVAFPAGPEAADRAALAVAEAVRAREPGRHGAFVQAMLVAVHLEGGDPADAGLVRVALRAGGLAADFADEGESAGAGSRLVDEAVAGAEALGVTGVPTLYRHGPPVRITTTPAVVTGAASPRLSLIGAMADDDGIWELAKP